jgi:hypothetical protein
MTVLICLAGALALTTILITMFRIAYKMIRTARGMTCPQCGARFAAQQVEKKPLGTFKKYEPDPLGGSGGYNTLGWRGTGTKSTHYMNTAA